MSKFTSSFCTIIVAFVFVSAARADVKLPAIFGDHMVVQRGMKIPIWGNADPNEKITVSTSKQNQQTTADDKGHFRVELDPINNTDEAIEITVAGAKNSVKLSDVLVGEVWVCSGQSNMEYPISRLPNGKEVLKEADHPMIRLFHIKHAFGDQPQDDVQGQWEQCMPHTAGGFSAVGYFFGQQLQQKLNVPIGLIESSWGGTRAEAWTPKGAFDRLNLPYEPAWTQEFLHPAPNPNAKRPVKPHPFQAPAELYNGMISPIAGCAMRGVIWYQGENNAVHAEGYHDVLRAMITGWRNAWGEGDFPFLIVQLANFQNRYDWPTIRAAQAQMTHDLPNVGLAVTIDIGNPTNIHPTDKLTVGKRLTLAAEKIAYGQDVVYSGPTLKSLSIDGDKAIVTFDHAAGGLVAKGNTLKGFDLAGEDGQFVPADAKIDGKDQVIVSTDQVKNPTKVRYGWANNPTCTLYNQSDLPAVPFEASK